MTFLRDLLLNLTTFTGRAPPASRAARWKPGPAVGSWEQQPGASTVSPRLHPHPGPGPGCQPRGGREARRRRRRRRPRRERRGRDGAHEERGGSHLRDGEQRQWRRPRGEGELRPAGHGRLELAPFDSRINTFCVLTFTFLAELVFSQCRFCFNYLFLYICTSLKSWRSRPGQSQWEAPVQQGLPVGLPVHPRLHPEAGGSPAHQ